MWRRGLAVLGLAALLSSCGKKTFNEAFNKSFDEKMLSSCSASATRAGVSQALAGKLCTCARDKVDERYSVSEKMNLKDEQLKPIAEECKASILR